MSSHIGAIRPKPFQTTPETFDSVMSTPPRARAAGCLHETFEHIHLVYTYGGRAGHCLRFSTHCGDFLWIHVRQTRDPVVHSCVCVYQLNSSITPRLDHRG